MRELTLSDFMTMANAIEPEKGLNVPSRCAFTYIGQCINAPSVALVSSAGERKVINFVCVNCLDVARAAVGNGYAVLLRGRRMIPPEELGLVAERISSEG